MFAKGESNTGVGDCWAGLEAHEVYFRPVFDNGAIWVVVLVPEESKVCFLFVWYGELVKHVLHICSDGVGVAAEPVNDSS